MKEEVFAAADAIELEGQTPTQAGIRERLGRGSMSTIAPALKEWRAAKAERAITVSEAIPLSVFSAMDTASAAIWAAAMKEADRIAAVALEGQKAAEKRAETLTAELAAAHQDADELRAIVAASDEAAKALIKAEAERDSLRERLAEARGTLAEMRREEKDSRRREVRLTERASALEALAKVKDSRPGKSVEKPRQRVS